MNLCPLRINPRERQILAGLYLSRFDVDGLNAMGFESFAEAFNAFGYGFGGKPASIKNYRDEFDPLFPNPRQGWKNRGRREYCVEIKEKYRGLSLDDFAELLKGFLGDLSAPILESDRAVEASGSFAKRLITGRAAENYFQARWSGMEEFSACEIEDTTHHGCGYDFRLWPVDGSGFKAVEVKGMSEQSGIISLTEKEYLMAGQLKNRYHLVVVKNFREKPFHEIHRSPLECDFAFRKCERTLVQISWAAAI
jgi:hypothetical protein